MLGARIFWNIGRNLTVAPQDLDMMNMDDFRHNRVNMTGLRLVGYDQPRVRAMIRDVRAYERRTGRNILHSPSVIKVS